MTSPMEQFLTELGRRGSEPILASATGTIRFDVHRGGRTEYRVVKIDRGKVTVTNGKSKADAVVDADGDLLDAIAQGKVNAMAATLRGALHVEGDTELLIQLQRAFPGPSNAPAVSLAAPRPLEQLSDHTRQRSRPARKRAGTFGRATSADLGSGPEGNASQERAPVGRKARKAAAR
jgi:putative sterol carrier protein